MPDCICGARGIDLEGHECIPSLRAQLAAANEQAECSRIATHELGMKVEQLRAQLAVSQQAVKDASEAYEASCEKVGLYHRELENREAQLKESEESRRRLREALEEASLAIGMRHYDSAETIIREALNADTGEK